MTNFQERAARSVNHVFSLFICYLVVSHSGFAGGTVVLIASFPGHCLHFTIPYLVMMKSWSCDHIYTLSFLLPMDALCEWTSGFGAEDV